jgi:hypothetical protein
MAGGSDRTDTGGCVTSLVWLCLIGGLAWYVPHRLGAGWVAVLVCFLVAAVTDWPHILVHELGHLVVALAVRLPVTEVEVAAGPSTRVRTWAGVQVRIGLSGRRSGVQIGRVYGRRWLAPRMVAMFLGGPAANLIVAALAAIAAPAAGNGGRAPLLMVAAVAFLRLVINLLPIPNPIGSDFDGWQALRWLLRPHHLTRRLLGFEALKAAYRAWEAGEPMDRAALTTLLNSPDRLVAASAALALLDTADAGQLTELLRDRNRLRWLATARGVPRETGSGILVRLVDGLIDQPSDRTALAAAVEMVQAIPGETMPATLAYLRLRQGRPASARHVLENADISAAGPEVRASALAVRAMVECALGDLAEAHRLVEEADSLDPRARWVDEARRAVAERAAAG